MKNKGTAEKNRNPGGGLGGGKVNVVKIFGDVAIIVANSITAPTHPDHFVYLSVKNEIATANCTIPTIYTRTAGNANV